MIVRARGRRVICRFFSLSFHNNNNNITVTVVRVSHSRLIDRLMANAIWILGDSSKPATCRRSLRTRRSR